MDIRPIRTEADYQAVLRKILGLTLRELTRMTITSNERIYQKLS